MSDAIFIDWLGASQRYPGGVSPVFIGGLTVFYDRDGNARCERTRASSVGGSFDTAIQVGCDGSRVWLSGNVGRFDRRDNLFNAGWPGTWAAANRILAIVGLPPFTAYAGEMEGQPAHLRLVSQRVVGDTVRQIGVEAGGGARPGARIHRLDLTGNFETGSDGQARAVIRWLASRSISRMKRGLVGSESCWWANTRHMIKAYLKGAEMKHHGGEEIQELIDFCDERGLVRVEVELKRRLLQEAGLDAFDAVTDEKLAAIYNEQTEIFRRVDRSDEPDILASIPSRYRMTAAAWIAGQDVRGQLGQAALYRHARVLREYGIDILQARNVEKFPVKVRVVDLKPLSMPDWYREKYFKVA